MSTVEEENDLFEKPEDDSVTTSTSVYVAQPGSPESGENYFLIVAPKKLGLHWLPTKFSFFVLFLETTFIWINTIVIKNSKNCEGLCK